MTNEEMLELFAGVVDGSIDVEKANLVIHSLISTSFLNEFK